MLICKSIFPQQRLTVNTELGKSKHKFRFMLQITYFVQQKRIAIADLFNQKNHKMLSEHFMIFLLTFM